MNPSAPEHREGRPGRPSSLGRGAFSAFDRARDEVRLSAPVALPIAAFPIVSLPAFFWFLALERTHVFTYVLLMENGVVELLTFAAFLAAAVAGLSHARRLRRRGAPAMAWRFFAASGAVAFVGGMEEIAWGQSFLNFETPWGLRHVNVQGELTIHNLPGLQDLNTSLLFLFGLAACLALWARRSPRWRPIAAPSLLGPYAAMITFGGAACLIVDLFYIQPTFDLLVGMMSEVVELQMAILMLLYPLLHARSSSSTPSATRSSPAP